MAGLVGDYRADPYALSKKPHLITERFKKWEYPAGKRLRFSCTPVCKSLKKELAEWRVCAASSFNLTASAGENKPGTHFASGIGRNVCSLSQRRVARGKRAVDQ